MARSTRPSFRRSCAVLAVLTAAVALSGCRVAHNMVEFDAAQPGEQVVALTFDDGPGANTLALLDVLDKYDVKATFFVVGVQASRYPELVDEIVRRGHHIGNHTWNHSTLTTASPGKFNSEVDSVTAWLAGRGIAVKCVRPPGGAQNPSVMTRLRDRNATYTALWSIDTEDWKGRSAAQISDSVAGHLTPGAVALMHDGPAHREQTVAAVDQMIPKILAAGYEIRPIC